MLGSTTPRGPTCNVRLPVGYRDGAGKEHRDAVLRKITGHEESLLYDPNLNPGKLVTSLLGACLVELGDLEAVDAKLVGQLLSSDRNYLLLQLRRFTLGDRLTAAYRCPSCQANVSVTEDLSTVRIRELGEGERLEPTVVELTDGYLDPEGTVHRRVELTAPRGVDEELVGLLARKDPLRAQDALVLRCIRSFGTLRPAVLSGSGVEILRSLPLGDRRAIVRAINELTLGPDFRRDIECRACGHGFEVLLDVSSFFGDG